MGHWNPLHDLVTLQDRMNRLFEDASQRRGDDRDEVEAADWYPAADVYETDAEFVVSLDVPGIDRATLDISLDNDRLVIKGQRGLGNEKRHQAECPHGKFYRTFSVPSSINHEVISAHYKDGVLKVHLPKLAERKAQKVEIKIS